MAIRDFKQIRGTDFNTAAAITNQAGKSFSSGFSALSGVLNQASNIQTKQKAQKVKTNDQSIQASLQQFGSLAELDQAERAGIFDTSKLRESYGDDFTPGDLQKHIGTTRAQLTREKMNDSIAAYGDALGDPNVDSEAMKKEIVAGASPSVRVQLNDRLNDYGEAVNKQTPEQKLTAAFEATKRGTDVTNAKADVTYQLQARQAKHDSGSAAWSKETAGNFVDVVNQDSIRNWFGGVVGDNDLNLDVVETMFGELTEAGLSAPDASALLAESWKAREGAQSHWLTGKGISEDILRKEVTTRKLRYTNRKAEQEAINADTILAQGKFRDWDSQLAEKNFSSSIGDIQQSRTGQAKTPVGGINFGTWKNTPAVTESPLAKQARKNLESNRGGKASESDLLNTLQGVVTKNGSISDAVNTITKINSFKPTPAGANVIKGLKQLRDAYKNATPKETITALNKFLGGGISKKKTHRQTAWDRAVSSAKEETGGKKTFKAPKRAISLGSGIEGELSLKEMLEGLQ